MKLRNYVRIWDMIIIAGILAGALVLAYVYSFAPTGPGESFYIKCDAFTREYTLDIDRSISVASNGITLDIEVKDGKVSVISSDCPDKLCVKRGSAQHIGDSIVCLPARLVVGISHTERGAYEADGIVG